MNVDRSILLAVLFLVGLGLVQVYSSSFIFATETYGDGLYFFRKQLAYAVLFVIVLAFTAYIPWKYSLRLGYLLWGVAVLGVAATYVPGLGVKVGGAHRWLALPMALRFEPGELLKITYPFVFSGIIINFAKDEMNRKWLITSAATLLPLGLLVGQPDFGSFVIIIGLLFSLLVAFGLRWRVLFLGASVVLPTLAYMIFSTPYRRLRVEAFLNPWSDPAEKGFQVIQSLLSFYSGGLTGVGLGQGQGKLFFLPEAHTDFTLAVLGEEMGFIGFFILMMVYGFLVFRGFQISLNLKRYRERCLALSFSLLLVFSVFINVGVTLGLLPTKGLTLPLISYGGSSLICTGLLFGWLLNLERESTIPLTVRDKEIE